MKRDWAHHTYNQGFTRSIANGDSEHVMSVDKEKRDKSRMNGNDREPTHRTQTA